MDYYDQVLEHHGIKGQRWGIRRFQNYDGTRIRKGGEPATSPVAKKGLTDEQKKALKIAAGVTAGLLVAYGGYKLATNPKAKALATNVLYGNKDKRLADLDKEIANMGPEIVKKSEFGGSSEVIGKIGKSIQDVDREMVSKINANGWVGNPPRLTEDCARNCSQTSIAYIMNAVLGKDVTAKGFGGVDEISGMVQNDGRNKNVFGAVFDGLNSITVPSGDMSGVGSAIKHIPSGTTGIVRLQNTKGEGHFLNYEKDSSGKTTFVDCQNGKVVSINESANYSGITMTDIFDCSNVRLREGASKYLRYMINS